MRYLPLILPLLCTAVGTAVIKYNQYVAKIPSVKEGNWYPYPLVPLGEEPALKITANPPILDGATALYPVYAAFARAVYPADKRDVLHSKTDDAYTNLLERNADIIFCAAPSEEQRSRFAEKGFDLKLVPIGKDAFVFFVNAENPLDTISIADIQGIYSGRIKNWKPLNGINKNIRAFQRPKNSGSQTALEKIMGTTPIVKAKRENISDGMGTVINEVAAYRNFNNAIGFSFRYFATEMAVNNRIKLLALNGVHPVQETIRSGAYPFTDSFYALYIDDEHTNEHTKAFITWMLSRQGQRLIEKIGYVPVNDFPLASLPTMPER